MKCTINDIAVVISESIPNPAESGYDIFVGLEHYDSGEVKVTRYGSTENLVTAVKVFKKGDILLARRNVYLKRAGLVDFDGVTSGDSIVLRVKQDLSNLGISSAAVQKYLPFVLNTEEFWNYAEKYSDGTMSKRLSPKTLLQYEFEIPEDVESKNELLWAAFDAKESYRAMIRATDEMVKSQFIEMFGRTTNSKFPVQKLSEVCSFKSGTTFSPDVEQQEGDYMYAKVADMNLSGNETYIVRSTKYVNSDTAKSTWLPKGSVVFPKRGAAIHTNKKRILSQNTCVDLNTIGVIPGKDINTLFLYWFFKCLNLSEICEDSGIPQINNKNLIPLDIVVPPMPEQIKFSIVAKQADKSKYLN